MIRPIATARAAGSFIKAFLGHRDPIAKVGPAGLTQLDGWVRIPETTALDAAQAPPVARVSPCLLYCYAGPHAGEFFPLRRPRATVGTGASGGVVLTPAAGCPSASFEFVLEDCVELIGVAPQPFELNGKTEYRATLVDYDEIVLLGNHFIVLEVSGGRS
jgi:hypothetical protein